MSDSSLSVTPGSGLDLLTDSRTITGGTKHMQVLTLGETDRTTYTATATNIATTTSGDHVLILQADGTNYVRVKRIRIQPRTLTGAAGTLDLQILRTTTAGSGGTTVNARPFLSTATDPYAGVCQTRPSAKGTEGNRLLLTPVPYPAAQPVTVPFEWRARDGDAQPVIFGTATSAGICFKVITGVATLTLDLEVEFTVTTWA